VDEQREGFTRRCAEAVERLAAGARSEGNAAEEVGWRRRAVALAPLEARPALRLAEGLVRAGDRPGALLALRSYLDRIRTELGVEGDPEVIRMAEQLAASLGR
jgi:DNA-binding SARP family transcriptional activator